MKNRIINLYKKYSTFIKYGISAGISIVIDLGLFTIFNNLLKASLGKKSIICSTIIARVISSVINFTINGKLVFKDNQGNINITKAIKYFILVVVQMFVSGTSVTYIFKYTSFNETLIKLCVDVVIFFINYVIQKKFIFNNGGKYEN